MLVSKERLSECEYQVHTACIRLGQKSQRGVPLAEVVVVVACGMARLNLNSLLHESLADFFEDGGRRFWQVFAETPLAAVAAFKARPEVFAPLERLYARSPKIRIKHHQHLSGLLDALLLERASSGGGDHAG